MPKLRPSVDDIEPYLGKASDAEETRSLIHRLKPLRSDRAPLYLTRDEFDTIAHWKLGNQYARIAERLQKNSDDTIRTVTEAAFGIQSADADHELQVRVRLISALDGVDIGVSSAILALTFPEDYAVLDFRGWRQAYGEDRQTFGVPHYAHYIKACISLGVRSGRFPQEIDLALWAMDIDRGGNPLPSRPETSTAGSLMIDEDPFNADWTKARALDGYNPDSFLSEFSGIPADEFKTYPIYHMNKYRNQWVRTLDW